MSVPSMPWKCALRCLLRMLLLRAASSAAACLQRSKGFYNPFLYLVPDFEVKGSTHLLFASVCKLSILERRRLLADRRPTRVR